jgi:NO-binding membrane sensor protein with MHYT domain
MNDVHQQYSYVLVALSYVISVLGSFTALQLALGISKARTVGQRWGAVLAAGVAMGGGAIWAMHFIAMLACNTGMPVTYDIASTGASAVLAVVACSIGLAMAGIGVFTWSKLVGAGTLMGLGVAGMHYLGMSAMLMSATMTYDLNIVAISVGIAIVASIVALWLAFHLRGKVQMLGSALVMGVAVCGMHYTGMAAVDFTDNGTLPAGFEQGLRGDYLGVLIFVVVVVLLGVALGLSLARQQRRVELTI